MMLKQLTADKHKQAEQMPFNQRLLKGEVSIEEYVRYLIHINNIYISIENRMYDVMPPDLLRSYIIAKDINKLREQHKNDLEFLNNGIEQLPSVLDYCTHLNTIDKEEVWPHVYLNYMALLYGGSLIKRKLPSPGEMYDFKNVEEIINFVREKQKDEWADEVNKGFDYVINIYKELENNYV